MVDLRTVRRVLALDLGMTNQAIRSYLDEQGWPADPGSDSAGVPLAEALRIVAEAADLALSLD